MLRHIGFPVGRQERRAKGLSPKIKTLSPELQDEFLKYFLAASAVFDWNQALLLMADVSGVLLEDVAQMIRARVSKESISFRGGAMADDSILSLSTIPTLELFLLGFLGVNHRKKSQVEDYWQNRVKSRAYGYLKRTYPQLQV